MKTKAEQLLLDLVAQIMIAPRQAAHSTAFEDAVDYFDDGDVEEAAETAKVADRLDEEFEEG